MEKEWKMTRNTMRLRYYERTSHAGMFYSCVICESVRFSGNYGCVTCTYGMPFIPCCIHTCPRGRLNIKTLSFLYRASYYTNKTANDRLIILMKIVFLEHRIYIEPETWGRLNIKMPSYQHRDSHVKDKTVSPTVLSLTWESLYLGKTVFILRRGPDSQWRIIDAD